MRQQLIEWLIDDVAPRVRRSGDPEGELIKFANEKNMSPALLEGLGQLFNTAKTLCYMDKSANRGDSFPLVNVQDLVSQYVEVPATKLASDPDGWLATDAQLKPSSNRMPSFLDLPETDGMDFEMDKCASVTKAASPRRPENPAAIDRANLSTLSQVQFDCEQDARFILDRFVKRARQGSLDFTSIELDALATMGDEAKPALDQVASYLGSKHITVKRATYDGKPRLVDCPEVVEIELIANAIGRIKEATVMIKEMEADCAKSASALLEEGDESPKAQVQDPKGSRGPSVASPVALPKFEMGDASKSPLKTAPDAMFELLKPSRDFFFKNVAKHIATPDHDHLKVDDALADSQHLALLQNLMTTDDVLAEADPDQVVSAYNTIRQTAPDLAKDINVMRVALRSAVQHEGIDPFTIKGIAETELARQKVQHGIGQQRDRAKGKPAPMPAGKE